MNRQRIPGVILFHEEFVNALLDLIFWCFIGDFNVNFQQVHWPVIFYLCCVLNLFLARRWQWPSCCLEEFHCLSLFRRKYGKLALAALRVLGRIPHWRHLVLNFTWREIFCYFFNFITYSKSFLNPKVYVSANFPFLSNYETFMQMFLEITNSLAGFCGVW